MIIRLEQNKNKKDVEVLITYPEKDKNIDHIVSLLESAGIHISCYSDTGIELIYASDIYYIESIDKKTVIHTENMTYRSKEKLYQIYEKLESIGFTKITKYCIININRLYSIKQFANSHLEAVLTNGKCLCVNRKYLPNIKQIIKERALYEKDNR